MSPDRERFRIWSFRGVLLFCIAWPLISILLDANPENGGALESLEGTLPERVHEVEVRMSLRSSGGQGFVRTFLPNSTGRQTVLEEGVSSGGPMAVVEWDAAGRWARWENVKEDVRYRYVVRTEPVSYDLEAWIPTEGRMNAPGIEVYLEPTESIQSRHPEVAEVARTIGLDDVKGIEALQRIHRFVSDLEPAPFKGTTDALTALRLGEASCNGKSRLFVALCRYAGFPSRLVGGLILEDGEKKTSHQWLEVYLSGTWVPFDALNGHFAALPANYLTLYHGDEALFGHSGGIPMDFSFSIRSRLRLSDRMLERHEVWRAFAAAGLPTGALGFLLMIPLGAGVVAFMRNVVGLNTFGLFLPALIAVSMQETGLGVGTLAFAGVIAVVAALHPILLHWRLLYTPRLVILLVGVVSCYLAISSLGWRMGHPEWVYVTLFPVVVVAITAERFAREIEEAGGRSALSTAGQTLVVVLAAFAAMQSVTVEALLLTYPEMFLWIVAAMMLLGRWTGVRVTEYRRFRFVQSKAEEE